MKCPYCKKDHDRVVDTRSSDNGIGVRRRRECLDCGRRFTSHEKVEEISVYVNKKSGSKELFDIQKVLMSVNIACRKRPISEEKIKEVADMVERQAMEGEGKQITSAQIGDLILNQLKKLDPVAFVRFSSVYKEYEGVSQFISALKDLESNNSEG
jgi:transcriptional repressor NrdR